MRERELNLSRDSPPNAKPNELLLCRLKLFLAEDTMSSRTEAVLQLHSFVCCFSIASLYIVSRNKRLPALSGLQKAAYEAHHYPCPGFMERICKCRLTHMDLCLYVHSSLWMLSDSCINTSQEGGWVLAGSVHLRCLSAYWKAE